MTQLEYKVCQQWVTQKPDAIFVCSQLDALVHHRCHHRHEQEHQMLHCHNITSNGAQLNWSIVEKNATQSPKRVPPLTIC